jgi:separase
MATTQRRRAATQTAAKGKPSNQTKRQPRTASADQLADALAAQLTISDGRKGKQKEIEKSVSDGEKLVASMRAVNAASQALSALVQSGWKRSAETTLVKKGSRPSAIDASESASKHLAVLRSLSPSDINVERVAISVLGKLVTLEMVRCAYF